MQKLTNNYIAKVDELAKTKEQELMSVLPEGALMHDQNAYLHGEAVEIGVPPTRSKRPRAVANG